MLADGSSILAYGISTLFDKPFIENVFVCERGFIQD